MTAAPRLRQLNVTYVEAEDRLLLKVSTSDDVEYRAWCTRRFTGLLLERLESMFENEVDGQQVVPEAARREVAQMQHGSQVREASFQRPYEAQPESFPLGERGILFTKLGYNELAGGVTTLSLGDGEGRGLTLNLDSSLRHQLYELFRRASTRAGWFDAVPAAPVVH